MSFINWLLRSPDKQRSLPEEHILNDADVALNWIRTHDNSPRMGMPNDSCFSRITNAISSIISSITDYIADSSISKTVSPITKLGALAVSSAVITSIGKTIADSIITTGINIGSKPIKDTFISGFTKDIFISNAQSSLWGLLIFAIAFPILKGLIHDQELQAPPIPSDHATAVELGCRIGKISTISAATWGTGTSLIAKFAPTGITNLVFRALSWYGLYKMVSFFI